MKKEISKFLVLPILLTPITGHVCDTDPNIISQSDNLTELELLTLEDSQIITSEDQRFCPGQSLNYQHVSANMLPDNGQVWRVGNNRWNDSWELKYQAWVKKNLNESLFEELHLKTDCADAALAIRAIFARIHNLPATFAGNRFSNDQKKWDRLPTVKNWSEDSWKENFQADERFKAALTEWMNGVGTVNLSEDTYPIEIYSADYSRVSESIVPGSLVLTDNHAEIVIYEKDSFLPYKALSSTVPAKVRKLNKGVLYTPKVNESKRQGRGVLWWNWVVNCNNKFVKVRDTKMPYYNNQQASNDFNALNLDLNTVHNSNRDWTEEEKKELVLREIDGLISSMANKITQRASSLNGVQSGFAASGKSTLKDVLGGTAFTSEAQGPNGQTLTISENENGLFEAYDEVGNFYPSYAMAFNMRDFGDDLEGILSEDLHRAYVQESTPNLDSKIFKFRTNILAIATRIGDGAIISKAQEMLDEKLINEVVTLNNGKKITYYHYLSAKGEGKTSSQPWVKEDYKWGIETASQRFLQLKALIGPSYDMYKEMKESKDPNATDEDSITQRETIEIYESSLGTSLKEYEILKKLEEHNSNITE